LEFHLDWRGRPLADVAHLPFARAHIAHLKNLRTTALLGRIEADIWSGHFREVIGELEGLMAERPDDGSVARLLVTPPPERRSRLSAKPQTVRPDKNRYGYGRLMDVKFRANDLPRAPDIRAGRSRSHKLHSHGKPRAADCSGRLAG
jgi:hypothetical protein